MPEIKTVLDPKELTIADLKRQPIGVLKTEIPALAKAIGVHPDELFRAMEVPAELAKQCTCCSRDSW
jgi:hypothetical protein